MEGHTLPQGEFAFLIEGQGEGRTSHVTDVGVGTFLDPRVGTGSAIADGAEHAFVEATDDDRLRYHLPEIKTALFAAPAADLMGNIYFTGAAIHTEMIDVVKAAKANGGKVIVAVAEIVPYNEDEIAIPTESVDFISVTPGIEQVASVLQRKYWPFFCVGGTADASKAIEQMRFMNNLIRVTPRRTEIDLAVARLAATVAVDALSPGSLVNYGVGLPEEVGGLLRQQGLGDDLQASSEAGALGGIPGSGMFFGANVNPDRIDRSAWMFHHYEENLDLTVLGMLEMDSKGNINVSRFGPTPPEVVGPGGFSNIAHYAKTIIFAAHWGRHAKLSIVDGEIHVDAPGSCKAVEEVQEVTFNAPLALERGQNVWYATSVGLFKLTERGVELAKVMPGIDIQRDIVDAAGATLIIPDDVPVVDRSIVTGENFSLSF